VDEQQTIRMACRLPDRLHFVGSTTALRRLPTAAGAGQQHQGQHTDADRKRSDPNVGDTSETRGSAIAFVRPSAPERLTCRKQRAHSWRRTCPSRGRSARSNSLRDRVRT